MNHDAPTPLIKLLIDELMHCAELLGNQPNPVCIFAGARMLYLAKSLDLPTTRQHPNFPRTCMTSISDLFLGDAPNNNLVDPMFTEIDTKIRAATAEHPAPPSPLSL